MASHAIRRSQPGKSEGSAPEIVKTSARNTSPEIQLIVTMTAISPLLMLPFPLSANIIFRCPGKSISEVDAFAKLA